MALYPDTEVEREVKRILVGESELAGKLVDPYLLRRQVVDSTPSSAGVNYMVERPVELIVRPSLERSLRRSGHVQSSIFSGFLSVRDRPGTESSCGDRFLHSASSSWRRNALPSVLRLLAKAAHSARLEAHNHAPLPFPGPSSATG